MTEKVEDLESPPAYQQPPPPTYQNPPPTYQNPPPAHPQTAFVSTQPVGYGGYGQPGMVAVSGPGGGTTVVVQQTAVRPASYLALSILVCIFCNLIFGIVAIILSVLSSSAADEGDLEGAKLKGRIACGISLAGIAVTVIAIIIVIVVVVVAVDDAVDTYNAYASG